jgi:hypothetical protein
VFAGITAAALSQFFDVASFCWWALACSVSCRVASPLLLLMLY